MVVALFFFRYAISRLTTSACLSFLTHMIHHLSSVSSLVELPSLAPALRFRSPRVLPCVLRTERGSCSCCLCVRILYFCYSFFFPFFFSIRPTNIRKTLYCTLQKQEVKGRLLEFSGIPDDEETVDKVRRGASPHDEHESATPRAR